MHTVVEPLVAAVDEAARVRAVEDLGLLGAGPEERFDRMTRMAAPAVRRPVGGGDPGRPDEQYTSLSRGRFLSDGPRETAFCDHTIRNDRSRWSSTMPPGTHASPTSRRDRWPTSGFYAGHPLQAPGGQHVGALCLVDDQPGACSDARCALLADLAAWVQRELDRAESSSGPPGPAGPAAAGHRRSPGFDIAGMCLPGAVGGDFFDWHPPRRRGGVTLADVMGKGLGAAIIDRHRACGHALDVPERPARRRGRRRRRALHGPRRTVAVRHAAHARLRPADGHVRYADAGHGLMLLVRADGTMPGRPSGGLPLGSARRPGWPERTVRLAPGDMLVAFSDGLLDLFDGRRRAGRGGPVVREATTHRRDRRPLRPAGPSGSPPVPDDVTVVAIRRTV